MPKVSVIVPVYGAAPYMERCDRSLFEQTLASIEYVFVDDCSPDAGIAILRKTLQDYTSRRKLRSII